MANNNTVDVVKSLKSKAIRRVLFVCLGNICRSPAADGIMNAIVKRHGQSSRWLIDSAGIGDWHAGDLPDNRMREHGRRRGYDFNHHARQVKASDFENFDLIIGMDSANIARLKRLAPTLDDVAKVQPMARWISPSTGYDHVPDPYYEGAEGFELVLDLLEASLDRLYAEIG